MGTDTEDLTAPLAGLCEHGGRDAGLRPGDVGDLRDVVRGGRISRGGDTAVLAAKEAGPSALTELDCTSVLGTNRVVPAEQDLPPGRESTLTEQRPTYRIPDVRFRRLRPLMAVPVAVVVTGSLLLHHALWLDASTGARPLGGAPGMLAVWGISLVFVVTQVILAWNQRCYTATPRQQAQLDRLRVAVVIPCYNEDPGILGRTLHAIREQSRPADHVIVIDDGSTVDYELLRTRWKTELAGTGAECTWIRLPGNRGKKHAQAAGFRADTSADVYVTIDSDSALEREALREGLKPLADPSIVSVAGLEMAYNYRKNLLTLAISARVLAFQLISMASQSSAGGSVLINPGAFSVYRGWVIRSCLTAYLEETFFGVPVTLGDDTALTFFALMHGKCVHQPSAVAMNVYPERLSHHLRQWTRWMRASTIRTFWRLRYLPMTSYGWWYVLWQQWAFLASTAVTLAIPAAWPATRPMALAGLIALFGWPWAIGTRLLCVQRSDQPWPWKLAGALLMPLAALWYLLVLRQIRFWGMATCHRQGWCTRETVEVQA